jgi:hypothetical protein
MTHVTVDAYQYFYALVSKVLGHIISYMGLNRVVQDFTRVCKSIHPEAAGQCGQIMEVWVFFRKDLGFL